MASFAYTRALNNIMEAGINFNSADVRCMLVMTNTTVDTQEDTTTISGFTTLDEYDGSGYSRQTLSSKLVTENTTNNRAEFSFANVTFSSVAAGTRAAEGALFYLHVTNDSDSVPLWFDDFASNITGDGGDIELQVPANGALHLANA